MKKTGEEEDWKKTRDRGGLKILSDESMKKHHLTPDKGETRGRERSHYRNTVRDVMAIHISVT